MLTKQTLPVGIGGRLRFFFQRTLECGAQSQHTANNEKNIGHSGQLHRFLCVVNIFSVQNLVEKEQCNHSAYEADQGADSTVAAK